MKPLTVIMDIMPKAQYDKIKSEYSELDYSQSESPPKEIDYKISELYEINNEGNIVYEFPPEISEKEKVQIRKYIETSVEKNAGVQDSQNQSEEIPSQEPRDEPEYQDDFEYTYDKQDGFDFDDDIPDEVAGDLERTALADWSKNQQIRHEIGEGDVTHEKLDSVTKPDGTEIPVEKNAPTLEGGEFVQYDDETAYNVKGGTQFGSVRPKNPDDISSNEFYDLYAEQHPKKNPTSEQEKDPSSEYTEGAQGQKKEQVIKVDDFNDNFNSDADKITDILRKRPSDTVKEVSTEQSIAMACDVDIDTANKMTNEMFSDYDNDGRDLSVSDAVSKHNSSFNPESDTSSSSSSSSSSTSSSSSSSSSSSTSASSNNTSDKTKEDILNDNTSRFNDKDELVNVSIEEEKVAEYIGDEEKASKIKRKVESLARTGKGKSSLSEYSMIGSGGSISSQMRSCGRGCSGCKHGPYKYETWRDSTGKVQTKYIGRA